MPPTTTTRNVRLAQLLHHRGLTPIDLAERLQVDEKTVQRWLNGQHVPHRRHQYAVASLLRADRAEMWPQADDIAARVALARAELLAVYATRRDVPVDLWAELASTASDDVAIITNTLAWLVESQPEMIDTLNLRAITGSSIRICLRDPDYQDPDAVGTDDEHAYPVRRALRRLAPLLDDTNSGGEIRLHAGTTTSIYRFGVDLLVSPVLAGVPNHLLPVMHVRESGHLGLFHRLITHSLVTWNTARPYTPAAAPDNADDDRHWPPRKPLPLPPSPPPTAEPTETSYDTWYLNDIPYDYL